MRISTIQIHGLVLHSATMRNVFYSRLHNCKKRYRNNEEKIHRAYVMRDFFVYRSNRSSFLDLKHIPVFDELYLFITEKLIESNVEF